ncbi:955_t:CDS:2, partial [Funneliformis geosporum]
MPEENSSLSADLKDYIKTLMKGIDDETANGVHDINELHKITHISKSTLYTYIRKLENFGTIKPKPHSGRPKLLSPKKWAHLGKLASTRKCATSKEIAFTLNQTYPNLNIAPRTIRENLFNL